MDFYRINEQSTKSGTIEVSPEFLVQRSNDLMIRSRQFHAIWDQEKQLWSKDEYDVQRLVDEQLFEYSRELKKRTNGHVRVLDMGSYSTRSWSTFIYYAKHLKDNAHTLDMNITFSNTETKKEDYISKRLDYPYQEGSITAYEELMNTIYAPEERDKLEWAVGAIITGDAKELHKFIVLYGPQGSGKSTFIGILEKLFKGYYAIFDAQSLTSRSNQFGTDAFSQNPLVGIQHDGDLSGIEDNSLLNSITAHEEIIINGKYKETYTSRIYAFLFMGTNKPVKITDAMSGIIRRLIDVTPTGNTLPINRYEVIMNQIDFELGAIAYHCVQRYRELGKNYYKDYIPMNMIAKTDVFFNFVEEQSLNFYDMGGITLKQAYDIYKEYCDDALIKYPLNRQKFREELKNYYETFESITRVNGKQVRSYFNGFKMDKFQYSLEPEPEKPNSLVLDQTESLIDEVMKDYPAQYANDKGTPKTSWKNVTTTVKDLDTSKLHYVSGPVEHIVIDFDLKDEDGNKSAELNLKAASSFPPTYAEFSQGGAGVHLHYYYEGDTDLLKPLYDTDIEVKVYRGNASIRRRLSKCNNIPMATLNSGLPIKGEKKMINKDIVNNENGIRTLIEKNLRKEIHPGTKPSIDFIYKILDDAYKSGVPYDVTNMKSRVLAFANNSSNQAHYCLQLVTKMQFKSEEESTPVADKHTGKPVVFDLEVYPNVMALGWKYVGEDTEVNVMINPTPEEINEFLSMRIIGFNNRRYDNHILYARYLGYNNLEIYNVSQAIINKKPDPFFREAFSLAHADIYEYSSNKMSLKKWMFELGIYHKEMSIPWDEPIKDEDMDDMIDYLKNDVIATEAVYNHIYYDYMARELMSDLSGLPISSTTRQHATKIFFGDNRKPQSEFVYTDLSEEFPGYKFDMGVSTYRDKVASEGGYVYAETGMYYNVALLDIASLHPSSAIILNIFGDRYTKILSELKEARLCLKHNELEPLKHLLGGRLQKYLVDSETIANLSHSLKIIINSIYGFTSATFENAFKDPRNIDNIVAKRGALFMIDLLYAVQEKGHTVVHIKTDSIKIANADQEIIDFVVEFGKGYGYDFEHEATYQQMCLVNDAVYVAKECGSKEWVTVGAQFKHPYVYKSIFEVPANITFEDMCEIRSVQSVMYLDHNENLGEGEHDYRFVGKVGSFTPIKEGRGGAQLIRVANDKAYAVTGTKGYRWLESSDVRLLGEEAIDRTYFDNLVQDARDKLSNFGDVDEFLIHNWPEDCVVKGNELI